MELCSLLLLLHVLVALPIYWLIDRLKWRLTPPPPPEIKAKRRDAHIEIRQALDDIERHNRGEDDAYWGDSDIHRLDMALAEASEIRYDPLDEYFPWWVKGAISLTLSKGLVDLALHAWFHGDQAFQEFQDWAWSVGYLILGILMFLIALSAWYIESRKNRS